LGTNGDMRLSKDRTIL